MVRIPTTGMTRRRTQAMATWAEVARSSATWSTARAIRSVAFGQASPVGGLAAAVGRGGGRAAGVLAGEDAGAHRRPGGDGQAERLGHRQQLALGRALQRWKLYSTTEGDRRALATSPVRVAAAAATQAGVSEKGYGVDLARGDQVVEPAHDLLDRGGVPGHCTHSRSR